MPTLSEQPRRTEDPVVVQARADLRDFTAAERLAQAIALSRTLTRLAEAAAVGRRDRRSAHSGSARTGCRSARSMPTDCCAP